MEGVDVSYFLESGAAGFDQVNDEGLEIFSLDKFEEFETGAVEEIVAWHGFVDYVEDRGEVFLLGNLAVVEFVLQTYALAEEFEGSLCLVSEDPLSEVMLVMTYLASNAFGARTAVGLSAMPDPL